MDRHNKYYSIIENLVTQHKKYPGNEAILEDIIDDVYSHSEVIINSITNESVIESYLAKVVSTSIITVPKKMNFHPEIRHRVVSPAPAVLPEPQNYSGVNTGVNTEANIDVNTGVNIELVDKMINAPVKEELPELPDENETLIELPEFQEFGGIEEDITEVKTQDEALTMLSMEEEPATEIMPEIDEPIDIQEPSMNLSLSAEPENLEVEEESPKEITACDELNLEEPEVLLQEEESPEEIVTSEELNLVIDEPEEIIQEESLIPLTAEENNLVIEPEDLQEETVEELNLTEEPAPLEELNEEQPGLLTEPLELNDNPQDLLLEETSSELETLPEVEEFSLEEDNAVLNVDLDENLTPDDSLNLIEDTEELKETEFTPTDYSKFGYTPQEVTGDDIDTDEIAKEIESLASKRPELNILKVYELKYKEKHSIPQIATELEMSESSVIEALSEMIAIV